MNLSHHIVQQLHDIIGPRGILTEPDEMAPYLVDQRHLIDSSCDLVVRPTSTDQVASVVRLCAAHRIPIVPRGGGTGLVCGAVANGGLILSTDRMNVIRDVDHLNHTMRVESGCILTDIQKAATEAACFFPLSLGAEGSCRIGGNLATNAGGINVLRYGATRELVLGLEVVLANGQIWSELNSLRKDNTGYDLKQLFIGSEGTLGIITQAVLKLYPTPRSKVTALVATTQPEAILDLFDRTRSVCGDRLTAFELISDTGMALCIEHIPTVTQPFPEPYPYYALIELASPRLHDNLREELEHVLARAYEDQIIQDAAFAESSAQARALWHIRESIPAAQTHEGASIKHDISVPVSRTVEFIVAANRRIQAKVNNVRFCTFGHIGDGNIHYNLVQPLDMDAKTFLNLSDMCNRIVHDLVAEMQGSISAEHGIGLLRREELAHYASSTKLELMRTIKSTLDPHNILNPGKVIQPIANAA